MLEDEEELFSFMKSGLKPASGMFKPEALRRKKNKNFRQKMSNITKLKFAALDISGKNYLSWILDAEIHLDAMNLGNTIK